MKLLLIAFGLVACVKAGEPLNGCGALDHSAPNLDLDGALPGAETSVMSYDGCRAGAAVLWTIAGGTHMPSLQPNGPALIFDFLATHPKR